VIRKVTSTSDVELALWTDILGFCDKTFTALTCISAKGEDKVRATKSFVVFSSKLLSEFSRSGDSAVSSKGTVSSVSTKENSGVGCIEGIEDGLFDGDVDGANVGSTDGVDDGKLEGSVDGIEVG